MGTKFRTLFNHAHTEVSSVRLSQLTQSAGGCQTRGPGTDHHHIELHGFSFH